MRDDAKGTAAFGQKRAFREEETEPLRSGVCIFGLHVVGSSLVFSFCRGGAESRVLIGQEQRGQEYRKPDDREDPEQRAESPGSMNSGNQRHGGCHYGKG